MNKSSSLPIALFWTAHALAQSAQMHPEVCGRPDAVIGLPAGFSVEMDRPNVAVHFDTATSKTRITRLAFLESILQACPLADGRVVVFAHDADALPDATSVYIVDTKTSKLIDELGGYGPIMSPDQRWIVFRKSYWGRETEPVCEEYLIYDLSRTPTENRPQNPAVPDSTNVGATIFPLGMNNAPFDNIGVPEDRRHTVASAFFWSSDSTSLVFADELLGRTSLVLIDTGGLKVADPMVFALDMPEHCGSVDRQAVIDVKFGPRQGDDRLITFQPGPACGTKPFSIHKADFRSAPREVHPPRSFSRKSIKGDSSKPPL